MLKRTGMTWTFLTYIRDSLRDGREKQLLKEGIPRDLIDKVRLMSLDEIEDLDQQHPALFPAVIEGALLRVLLDALEQGASDGDLKEVAEKWREEHPYGSNVIKFSKK